MARGRTSSYTPEVAEKVCAALSTGKLLRQVCTMKDMPSESSVFLWLSLHPDFAERYARAKELQVDAIAADTLAIADRVRDGKKTEEKQVAWACSGCGKNLRWRGKGWIHTIESTEICADAKADKVVEIKTTTGDMVDRARLMVDTRKWLLSKMAPKKYGDRLELAGDKDNPLTLSWADVMRERRAKRLEGEPDAKA